MIEAIKKGKNTWINCEKPTDAELKKAQSMLELPDEFIASLQDIDETPFVERNKNQLLILLQIPVKTGQQELPYRTVPLGIVATKEKFATICMHENEVIAKFRTGAYSFTRLQPVLGIIYASARTFLAYLKEINKEMHSTERDLQKSTRNKDLLELFELEKSLIYFSTSINSNRVVLERISKLLPASDKELFDDAAQEYKQAASMTKIYSIVLTVMMETFGSIISNNLNVVIKMLTSITIILMIPTLVASLYGMNVPLPFQDSPNAFLIVLIISITLSLFGIAMFWRKELF